MRSTISISLALLIFIVFLAYFWYQFYGFLFGSKLLIYTPSDGESFKKSDILVRGMAAGIPSLHLNGRPIYTDEHGYFEESLLFARGLNIIELKGKDKFGKILKERRMIYVTN